MLFTPIHQLTPRAWTKETAPHPRPHFAYNHKNRDLGHPLPYKEPHSMSTLEVSPADTLPELPSHSVTNDFSIQVATVNGSGSQTANSVIMRATFQMGRSEE